MKDKIRGTLWAEIIDILEERSPSYVILENVGNFERHDAGKTWATVSESLQGLGYHVSATLHLASGGEGLVSPHHLGFPQHRERFFVVASKFSLPNPIFPSRKVSSTTSLDEIVQLNSELDSEERKETRLTEPQTKCINHWNRLIQVIPTEIELPSFPIWSDEWGARYPFEGKSPHQHTAGELRPFLPHHKRGLPLKKREMIASLPSYAREKAYAFPGWKKAFIRQNRAWYSDIKPYVPSDWLRATRRMPSSFRKLEWNTKGEARDLWRHILQFRPSGLRNKRYASSPALVAMTATQIPILGPKARFLTRKEGLRLQGFPTTHVLPKSRADAFQGLGNAVHVGVAKAIASKLLPVPNVGSTIPADVSLRTLQPLPIGVSAGIRAAGVPFPLPGLRADVGGDLPW